jgi:hypothetical protein
MVINCLQVYVNAMLAQYVLLCRYDAGCLYPLVLRRLNARTRYQALADASIPLSTLNLGSMSSRSAELEHVDRELQSVRSDLLLYF